MSVFTLVYPAVDPIALQIGPVAVRWYGLAYLSGLLIGWALMRRMCARSPSGATPEDIGDFLFWAVIGIIAGGRLGEVIFYQFEYFLNYPWRVFAIWQGGMAFHGGMLGLVLAGALFTRARQISFPAMADMTACVAPIGLFFGRVANFINGELLGREAPDFPLAMVFPRGGPVPRHPSQLYEAALEGLLLAAVMAALWRVRAVREAPGTLFGVFLAGYGIARGLVELVREPEAHIGLLAMGLTTGQWLSAPMVAAGAAFIYWAQRKRKKREREGGKQGA
ncbi:MAG: prolipoprotein diacylglyceryl transferase [Rhodospirillales bacterium]